MSRIAHSASWAMDRPVVATTYPGLANLVENRRNGCIIGTQDPDGLAQAIGKLRESKLTGIRETVPAAFTLEAMVEAVIGVYESLM